MTCNYDVVICGAGITGVSAAYFLAKAGVENILLVDERPPLTLTSDRSTECYRNWWADPELLSLMNRSIDLMEMLADESANMFRLNRRGYLYVTADESKIPALKENSSQLSALGAGPFRIHSTAGSGYRPASPEDFHGEPDGADLLLGQALIHRHFPYITDRGVAALHVRRAGWLSAQQLGMYLLEFGRRLGVQFEAGHVESVETASGRVRAIRLGTNEQIGCSDFVNAAGPHLKSVGGLLDLDIPVYTELHLKVAFRDHLYAVARDAPLLIWDDSQILPWDEDQRILLNNDPDMSWLTQPFTAGAHTRPEGTGESQTILMLWEYKKRTMRPIFPLPLDEQFPEIALRGLATMLPRLREYFGRAPRPQIDGGYYVKTRENRLLAGPLPVDGAFVIGAASGYGIMAACAAGELLAAHVTRSDLPKYAAAFSLARYEDANYLKRLENWGESGQL